MTPFARLTIAGALVALAPSAPAQTILFENFENGIPDTWLLALTVPPVTTWQAVPAGTCQNASASAGFTTQNCSTGARGFPSGGLMQTPLVSLVGQGPFELVLDSTLSMNLLFDEVSITASPDNGLTAFVLADENSFTNDGVQETLVLPIPVGLEGSNINISFNGNATTFGAGGLGWLIDNVEVRGAGDDGSFCFGDGSGTSCPCGNDAAAGSNSGCLNSSGAGAQLIRSGNPSVQSDTLTFNMLGGPPQTFGLLVSADNQLPQTNPGAGIQAFDGLRCVGGNLIRHGTRALDQTGSNVSPWGFGGNPQGGLIAQGNFAAGQTRHWQVFYRDLDTLVCGSGQNTSNANSVTFVP